MAEPPVFVTALVAASAAVGGVPHRYGPETGTSLDDERREILETVLDVLAGNPPDPDQMAACRYLLKHLAQTAGRQRPFQPRPIPMSAMMDC